MFVPRPLASLRQKTLPHNNSRLRDSGEVGSRNSRLTVYPACPIDATPAKQRYFFCMLSVFCKLGWPEATSQLSPPNDSSPQHRPFRNGPREMVVSRREADRRRGPDAPAGNGHTKAAQTMALTCTTGSRGENPGSAGALAVFQAGS